jgi:hypothetical protein
VTRAIGIKESGLTPDCHNAEGDSGERWCYQLMPDTWYDYSIKVLGYYEENPSPVTVEYVTTIKVQEILEKKKTPEGVALAWNAGGATECSKGINKFNVKYDSCSYIKIFNNIFNKLQ